MDWVVKQVGKSALNMPADAVPGESSLPGLQMSIFSLSPLMVGRGRGKGRGKGRRKNWRREKLSGVLLYKDTNPIIRAPNS